MVSEQIKIDQKLKEEELKLKEVPMKIDRDPLEKNLAFYDRTN